MVATNYLTVARSTWCGKWCLGFVLWSDGSCRLEVSSALLTRCNHAAHHSSDTVSRLQQHWVPQGTSACLEAQRNFVESMAGYSLVCFFMQIKDRHNGNIMLDERGHIIHIDFGFMLSNSPGGVNFEAAPFKLTRELLEVMDSNSEGKASELFDYYKVIILSHSVA